MELNVRNISDGKKYAAGLICIAGCSIAIPAIHPNVTIFYLEKEVIVRKKEEA